MVGFRGKKKMEGGKVLQSERSIQAKAGKVGSQAWQGQSVLGKGTGWTEKLGPIFGGV